MTLNKTFLKKTILVLILGAFASCHGKQSEEPISAAESDIAETDSISELISAYTDVAGNVKGRQFIRTANLKFRVNNLVKATEEIERIATSNKGFVTTSKMTSFDNYLRETQISQDSLLETRSFTLNNEIILRIPDNFFDSAISTIGQYSNHWELRELIADDVSLSLYGNQLAQNRLQKKDSRFEIQISKRPAKLVDALTAEEQRYAAQRQFDESKLSQIELVDKINFSTLYISLTQRPVITHTTLPAEKTTKPYEAPFLQKLASSISHGWVLLEELVLILFSIWPVFILASLGLWIFRKKMLKKMNSSISQ